MDVANYKTRVCIEIAELLEKRDALVKFIETHTMYPTLLQGEQYDLTTQVSDMNNYLVTLERRLFRFINPER